MTRPAPIIVFAGPSLPPAVRPTNAAFEWRPPAMAGDGLTALEDQPRAVVLIDGLFDRYPAVRHKELLALIEAGVPVIGGASMGALRAAELHTLGMMGVGRIFEAYAGGRLTGDDEVAVLHGPAEMDWAALTVPLVNVRATLLRAVRERVIGAAEARRLRETAARIFFQDRTWRLVTEAAQAEGQEIAAFERWLPVGAVDLKQLDALACLAAAVEVGPLAKAAAPAPRTHFTETLARSLDRKPRLSSS